MRPCLWIGCFVVGTVLTPTLAKSGCPSPTLDVNASASITVADVQCVILTVLAVAAKKLPVACLKSTADFDCSGETTVTDTIHIIRAALGEPLNIEVDEDGDGCLDSCQHGCCTARPDPGCADADCEDCVCAKDPYCCLVGWDDVCAWERSRTCMPQCGCLPMDIADDCVPHGTTNYTNLSCGICVTLVKAPFCKEYYWDEICVLYAATCPDCGCTPPKGDCCEPHFGLGCNNTACESCICGLDNFCCTVIWDEHCAVLTRTKCPDSCTCPPLPPKGDCCSLSGVPGCDEPSCEACVCQKDPLCCESRWDGPCLHHLYTACDEACSCYSAEGTGDCCTPHDDSGGCGEKECSQCVCQQDPFCCTIGWFESCAIRAKLTCAAECPCQGTP
ncbi:MAG: hypothetical protein HUU55_20675 [Myxococcales bacterium]|nr:hypothetical protein [Myxococcales bacterium]